MNSPDFKMNSHLEAAWQRVRTAVEQAAEHCTEGLGWSALSAGQIKRREALLGAQLLFRKQQGVFGQRFLKICVTNRLQNNHLRLKRWLQAKKTGLSFL